MEEISCVKDLLLWIEHSCCVEKHAVVCCGWISWSAVWITKLCYGWKLLISGEAHNMLWMSHFISMGSTLWYVTDGPCVDKHTVCFGQNSYVVWIGT
jgi:hypothetical protein